MTQVFYSSTFFGAMSVAAAIDAGCFGARHERRLLIVSSNSAIPEINPRVDELPGFETLADRFDEVVCWNELIEPLHPADWLPRGVEVPLLARLIRAPLGLPDHVSELVVESIAVAPARAIATLIPDCPITVYSDGLMSYGPTRDALPRELAGRITRLLYLGLVAGLQPMLLREYGVVASRISDDAFEKVLSGLPAPALSTTPTQAQRAPVIIGQYLTAVGILSRAEEAALHADMLRALVLRGHKQVAFKPHPAASRTQTRPLRAAATRLQVDLTVVPETVSAEAWFATARPALVVSCFSTALFTARHFFDLPIAAVGTELALERITPYQNSNRIPATIVDALVPQLELDGQIAARPPLDIDHLAQAVGYCMQAARHPELRDAATAFLAEFGPERYFKKRRLESLGLRTPPLHRSPAVTRTMRGTKRAVSRARRSAIEGWRAGVARPAPPRRG